MAVVLAAAILAVPAPQGERVPDSAVVNGIPQGIFVGRSLLTGRAVCLLFLSGGRITRAIPEGGLERFDWSRHQAAHGPDSGTWQLRGTDLVVKWGDGGVHQGPLTIHSDGIEFYGKRYSKPVTVDLAAIAGRWESSRGTAIAGGPGVNRVSQLVIGADGRYQWVSTTGGVVEGRAVSSDRSLSGKVSVRGLTIVFTSDAGTTTSCTLLPAAGTPVTAFSVDADMFTRSGPAAASAPSSPAAPATPPASGRASAAALSSYQGLTFAVPQGWTSGMQQGRFVVNPTNPTADSAVFVVVSGAEKLNGTLDDWLRAKMTADLAGGKVLQSAPATRAKSGSLDVLSAGRTVQDPSGVVMLQLYYAITDGQQAGLAMTMTVSEAALKTQMPTVQTLLRSLKFGNGRMTIAPSDLIGHWDHAASSRFVASPGTSAKGYAQGYTFSADGTYTYAFTGMIDRVHFNESDSGTWTLQNGLLVVRSRERSSSKSFQIIQLQTATDGSTALTLLSTDYPATESNINAWGERYVRKTK